MRWDLITYARLEQQIVRVQFDEQRDFLLIEHSVRLEAVPIFAIIAGPFRII